MTEKHKIHESLTPLKIWIDAYQLDPKNARKNHDIDGIAASLDEFEQRTPLVVNKKTGTILKGNGTWKAAKQLGWTHIAALVVSEPSTEAIKYAIADNLLTDKSVFDIPTLNDLFETIDDPMDIPGVSADWLESLGVGIDLGGDGTGNGDGGGSDDDRYTKKIEAPIYEIKGDKPETKDLFDDGKTSELLKEIDAADIPKDIANFLKTAAQRHTSFHFARIAEFYAHSGPEVQSLMEKSALVIIDFDKAIENGFVKMTERLGKIADMESQNNER